MLYLLRRCYVCSRRILPVGKIGPTPLSACICTQKTKGCPDLERKVETKFTRLIGTTFRFLCAGACEQGGGPDFPTGKTLRET
jgi:hypothetical protein